MRGMLPTPKANDFRSGMANRVGTVHTQQLNDTIAYRTGKTSRLNPLFVEEMMGFPTCWILLPFCKSVIDRHRNPVPRWRIEAIKCYGNAIVPQVAYRVLHTIRNYINAQLQ